MNIIEAAQAMRKGKKVRRLEWRKDSWLAEYVAARYMHDDESSRASCIGTEDLLATDWEIVE